MRNKPAIKARRHPRRGNHEQVADRVTAERARAAPRCRLRSRATRYWPEQRAAPVPRKPEKPAAASARKQARNVAGELPRRHSLAPDVGVRPDTAFSDQVAKLILGIGPVLLAVGRKKPGSACHDVRPPGARPGQSPAIKAHSGRLFRAVQRRRPRLRAPHTFSHPGCNFSVPFAQKDARFARAQIKPRPIPVCAKNEGHPMKLVVAIINPSSSTRCARRSPRSGSTA